MTGVAFDFAAQACHQQVDGAVERFPIPIVDRTQQVIAGENAPSALDELIQQTELARRQFDFPAVRRPKLSAVQVESPAIKGNDALLGIRHIRARRPALRYSAHNTPDAHQQFTLVPRFDDIIIGADFQPDDAVDRIVLTGEEDDAEIVFVA